MVFGPESIADENCPEMVILKTRIGMFGLLVKNVILHKEARLIAKVMIPMNVISALRLVLEAI